MMDVRPIETEADHAWALREVEAYFDREPAPGTPDAARFSVLVTLIEAYEEKTWPIDPPEAIDALHEYLAWRGLGQEDLGRILGSPSLAGAVLDRKTGLTMEQAWRLHQELGIPADILLRPVPLAAE